MNPYTQSADTYIAQRLLGASPELQAALIMEAGQRFLGKAIKAMEEKNLLEVARLLGRVAEVITEAELRLNHEDGGEVVENLQKIHRWWFAELVEAGRTQDPAKLRMLSHHMGVIRSGWQALDEKQQKNASPAVDMRFADRVV
jgi:flagellar biosynthetic protein FliS